MESFWEFRLFRLVSSHAFLDSDYFAPKNLKKARDIWDIRTWNYPIYWFSSAPKKHTRRPLGPTAGVPAANFFRLLRRAPTPLSGPVAERGFVRISTTAVMRRRVFVSAEFCFAFHSDLMSRANQDQAALLHNLMHGTDADEADDKEQDTPYRDTEHDRELMNQFCVNILGFMSDKFKSEKGEWDGAGYAAVTKKLGEFKKQHVRQAYREQLHIIIQSLFGPVVDSLWCGIDKVKLFVEVSRAWTRYMFVCDKLSSVLKNLVLNRGSEIKDGINLYADSESDFRLSAISLFRSRLAELEPLLMDGCGDFVVRVLNGEDMSKYFAADHEPLRYIVDCFVFMHDCSGRYNNQEKNRWATDRKQRESVACFRYGVKPKTDETELYCASGGLEDALICAASLWFRSQAQSSFADIPLVDAVSRLRQLFSSTRPCTLRKINQIIDEMQRA